MTSNGDILELLDRSCETYAFPMLNHVYYYYSKARLDSFLATDARWLIVFQVLEYCRKTGEFGNFLYAYGSLIPNLISTDQYLVYASDLDSGSSFNRYEVTLSVSAEHRPVYFTEGDYAELGIPFTNSVQRDVARILGCKCGDILFLSTNQLLDFFSLSTSSTQSFLSLVDWYHPDIADDELPSQSSSMNQLASALSSNDVSLYKLQGSGNTHWSNWQLE